MTIVFNTTLANAQLDDFAADFPAGSILEIRTGAPAGPDNAAGGSLLASITLPASPWAAAASKQVAKQGTWSNTAGGTGVAGHYRLKNSGDTKRVEGTVTATGGGGDATIDNVNIANGQTVTVVTFVYTS